MRYLIYDHPSPLRDHCRYPAQSQLICDCFKATSQLLAKMVTALENYRIENFNFINTLGNNMILAKEYSETYNRLSDVEFADQRLDELGLSLIHI